MGKFAFNYIALIERPDGTTYEQGYDEFDELLELKKSLGSSYWIIEIY